MKIRRRSLLLILLIPMLCIAALAVLSPWWIPVAGGWLAGRYGAGWSEADSEGYAAIRLTGVEYVTEGVEVEIDQLRLPQPWPWVWGLITPGSRPTIRASHVVVRISIRESKSDQPADTPQLDEIVEIVQRTLSWMPDLEVDRLEIRGEVGDLLVPLERISLKDDSLEVVFPGNARLPGIHQRVWVDESRIRFLARLVEQAEELVVNGEVDPGETGWTLEAEIASQGIPLSVKARFSGLEPIPESAEISAEKWPVPVHLLPSSQSFPRQPLLTVKAASRGTDYDATITLDSGEGIPAAGDTAIVANFQIQGNTGSLSVGELHLRSNWFQAELSEPFGFTFDTLEFSNSAVLDVRMDLDRQDLIAASGRLSAILEVNPRETGSPDLIFSANGGQLQYASFPLDELRLNGLLRYPLLEVTEAWIQLGEGSILTGKGSYDFRGEEVDASVEFTIAPDWLTERVDQVEFAGPVGGHANIAGPASALIHEGAIESIAVQLDGFHPLSGRINWKGSGLGQVGLEGAVESSAGGHLEFLVAVRDRPADNRVDLSLESLELGMMEDEPLQLEEPVDIQLSRGDEQILQSVSAFNLGNAGTSLSGSYSASEGVATFNGKSFKVRSLEAWLTRDLPALAVESVSLRVDDARPFLHADYTLGLRGTDTLVEDFMFEMKGSIGESGIAIEALEGMVGGQSFLSGSAQLPFGFQLDRKDDEGLVRVIRDGALQGEVSANLSSDLIRELGLDPFADLTDAARLELTLAGSLENPEANLVASMSELNILHLLDEQLEGFVFRDLELSLGLTPDQLNIEYLRGNLEEAGISVSGNLETVVLRDNLLGGEPDWMALYRQLEMHLDLENLQAKPFSSFLPAYLRPSGRISGLVNLEKGGRLNGQLLAEEFSIRPTLISQTINRIRVALEFEDRLVSINEAHAYIGESRVEVSGSLDFENLTSPFYSIKVIGSRTPLVRTPDLLLLADLDLSLDRTTRDSQATLSGRIAIRDSVVLVDIDPFGARTAGTNLPKPPFFSMTAEPFSEWLLEVEFTGQDSIRFRSQFATALLSVNFNLDGSMVNPVLVGNLNSKEGHINFPGTRLSLAHSEIFITRNRLNSIQLDINTVGQTSSYVVTMQVTGSVTDPQVEFASTPSLTNAQIFQLLATGSVERSGFGSVGIYLGRGMLGPGSGGNSLLNRLTVEVGRDVTESGENTIDAYYEITERLRFHGQYDKYEAHNLDLEWEVYSK